MAEIRRGGWVAPYQKNRGFTVVELLVAMAIVVTLAAIAVPNLLASIKHARIAKAVGDIRAIGTDIEGCSLSKGVCPNTLTDVGYGSFNDPTLSSTSTA